MADHDGYPLPLVVNPLGRIGVCVPVPDDEGHRQAFLGALLSLTYWYNWQPDPAHIGREAAAVWLPIFNLISLELAARTGCDAQNFGFLTRYNPDTDTLQVSFDGGATWVDAPDLDPRNQTLLPPLDTADPRCDSAANIVHEIRSIVDQQIEALQNDAGEAVLATLITAAMALFGYFALLVALAVALAGLFLALGAHELEILFTDELYDTLLCIFYCRMNPSGQLDAERLALVISDINEQLVLGAALLLTNFMNYAGYGGLNNIAASGSQTGDCDDCGCSWCREWDSTNGLDAWTHGVSGAGTWDAANHRWMGTSVGAGLFSVDIVKSFTATPVSSVSTRFGCSSNDGARPSTFLYLSGVQVARVDSTIDHGIPATNFVWTANFSDVTCDQVRVYMSGNGGCTVDQEIITGVDENPFGTSNC